MPQFADFDPSTYLELIRSEVPDYDELQDVTAAATEQVRARRILELGVGSGETLRRLRAVHPEAQMVGVDRSEAMLERAREVVPDAELRVAALEDDLPPGPFDLVVSALAVHHLPAEGKRELFGRVAAALESGGAFVLADVIVPADPADAITPLEKGFDLPDRLADQLEWLREAGLAPEVVWARRDLAVVRAGG